MRCKKKKKIINRFVLEEEAGARAHLGSQTKQKKIWNRSKWKQWIKAED